MSPYFPMYESQSLTIPARGATNLSLATSIILFIRSKSRFFKFRRASAMVLLQELGILLTVLFKIPSNSSHCSSRQQASNLHSWRRLSFFEHCEVELVSLAMSLSEYLRNKIHNHIVVNSAFLFNFILSSVNIYPDRK